MLSFSEFIFEEFSKNDPIPEISKSKTKLGIVLLGLPGAGKSTFINNFILPRNPQFKSFSTDDVSHLLTKDPKAYDERSAILNIGRLSNYIKTGQNFIYDTTGAHEMNIFRIVEEAREQSYKIVFIQLETNVDVAKSRNISRLRVADEEYIDFTNLRLKQNMELYSRYLKPDSYYIVDSTQDYIFFKYQDGRILKRDFDKYI
jgi:predicted ABC-type ATPase